MNFVKYVEKRSVAIPFSGCRIWIGATTPGGYGNSIVAYRLHGTKIVHRALFRELQGHVPPSAYVCHHCDTPSCVNPDHLFLGTPNDNAQDRKNKGRSASKRGKLNGRSVLTPEAATEIRALLGQGKLQRDVAKRFGVSQATVSRVKIGLSWGELN